MTSDPKARSASDNLQFDRAVHGDGGANADGALACARCDAPIRVEYYQVDGLLVCPTCKQRIEREERDGATRSKSAAVLTRALLFGLGAAVAGAIIYYAVGEITGLEIGIVAILIGFMVGAAVKKGTSGHGARRFQFLAAGLTYFAIGLAYSPAVVQGVLEAQKAAADSAATAPAPASDTTAVTVASDDPAVQLAPAATVDSAASAPADTEGPGLWLAVLIAFGGSILVILALPAFAVIASLPGGAINGLIIAFGLHQAWRMTGAHRAQITGPYKVSTIQAA